MPSASSVRRISAKTRASAISRKSPSPGSCTSESPRSRSTSSAISPM
jgi:hypothetical protein